MSRPKHNQQNKQTQSEEKGKIGQKWDEEQNRVGMDEDGGTKEKQRERTGKKQKRSWETRKQKHGAVNTSSSSYSFIPHTHSVHSFSSAKLYNPIGLITEERSFLNRFTTAIALPFITIIRAKHSAAAARAEERYRKHG